MKDREGHQINARAREKLLLESYRCAAGPASVLPEHSREEYQIGVSLNFPREYSYWGDRHAVPVGTLSVLHPGKTHSARAPRDRQTPASFRMMYADPTLLRQAATGISGLEVGSPFFPATGPWPASTSWPRRVLRRTSVCSESQRKTINEWA